jgi:hypothetical protein
MTGVPLRRVGDALASAGACLATWRIRRVGVCRGVFPRRPGSRGAGVSVPGLLVSVVAGVGAVGESVVARGARPRAGGRREGSGREQLAESRYEPRAADLSLGGTTVRVPFYTARFRLLSVVFDVFGHGPTEMGLHADLSDDPRRALLPVWPSEHPVIWWPPVTNLDVIGGVTGLAAVPLTGVPAVIPPRP